MNFRKVFAMRYVLWFLAFMLAGCGGSENVNKPGKPTAEQIAADQEEQKRVEGEERGTPIPAKKKK